MGVLNSDVCSMLGGGGFTKLASVGRRGGLLGPLLHLFWWLCSCLSEKPFRSDHLASQNIVNIVKSK